MNIKMVKVRKDAKVPARITDGAVAYDAYASRLIDGEQIKELPVTILPGGKARIGIGVKVALPWPMEITVRPRSGLAMKHDVTVLNSPGTIDSDYRGEIGVILKNFGENPVVIEKGMRIAQLSFSLAETPGFELVDELPSTRREENGFGSTGLYGKGIGTQDYDQAIRDRDEYYMKVVLAISERSTCARGAKKLPGGEYERDERGKLKGQTRKLGCVIVKDDNILAQGFNDQYPGSPKCADCGCMRDKLKIKSGTKIEKCRAMHAEWWAITNLCRTGGAIGAKGATMYINAEPCEICAKLIAGLGIEAVVVLDGVYPTNGTQILKDAGISIRYVKL